MERTSKKEIKSRMEKGMIPVGGNFDVVVVGGGFSGVAAAISAARMGKRVLLLEKRIMPGGLATAGIITHYLAICDGHGRKIIRGLGEELLHTAIRYSYDTLSEEWRDGPDYIEHPSRRYETWFSFPECVVALEELLLSEGVEILYDSLVSSVCMKNGYCEAVVVEEKGGTIVYTAKAFVDATGDATLFQRAGASTAQGDNLVSYGAHHMDVERCKKAVKSGKILDALEIRWYGDFPMPGEKRFPLKSVSTSREATEFILQGRSVYLERLKSEPQDSSRGTVLWPSMMMARKVRRMEGEYTLTPNDVNRHMMDSVGCVDDWRTPGPIYEIPFRALYCKNIANILACGRCISSDGDAWEVTRVIPPAVLTGQAAGTAAALMAERGVEAAQLNVNDLQKELESAGVLIHF